MNFTFNNTNGTDSSPPGPTIPVSQLVFITIAALALLTNVFILIVFFFKKELWISSALLVGLTTAHALNGASHLLHGIQFLRIPRAVPPLHCVKIVEPLLFITVYQLLPILLALNGMERLLALGLPTWYWNNCKNRHLWKVTGITFGFSLLCMLATIVKILLNTSPTILSYCIPPQMLGPLYTICFVHLPAILGGICAGVCSGVAVHIGRRRIAKMPGNSQSEIKRIQKHLKITKCILLISVFDFVFVVIPNIIFILYNFGLLPYGPTLTGLFGTVYCSDSIWNLFAFILFNSEFREVCMNIIRCGKTLVMNISLLPTPADPRPSIGNNINQR